MKKSRGIALISILAICAVLLFILGVGLKLGSNGVLFVSQVHKRNVALSAAEAGVYEAMAAIAGNKGFSGTWTGTLSESKASYKAQVTNSLSTAGTLVVVSTGEFGGVKRTLRAELEPDALGFDGVSVDGKVYMFDQGYVNAIASPENPVARPGNIHTQFIGAEAAYQGRDFGEDGTQPLIHVTGSLTSNGSLGTTYTRTARSAASGVNKSGYRLDPVQMQSGSFTTVSTLSGGTLSGNTEIGTDPDTSVTQIPNKLIVPKGVTLVVNGRAEFLGGLAGEGEVVVNGDAIVRTDANFDPNTKEGVKLYSSKSVFLTHPEAELVDSEVIAHLDPVGDYFAQMPMEASVELAIDFPTAAPKGGAFFNWFNSAVSSPNSEFDLWYNGDGTDIHPGLSQETKDWLLQSEPLKTEIADWAASTSGL